jgi:hypothetical protein
MLVNLTRYGVDGVKNFLAIFIISMLVLIQQTIAQTDNQSLNEISLICKVTVVDTSQSNVGQVFENYYRITINPSYIYFSDGSIKEIKISETEMIWEYGYINRLTGHIALGEIKGLSGKCEEAPTKRKF